MTEFKELASETLAKIMSFGIRSRTVIKTFKCSCRLLDVFLQNHNLEFTAESGRGWLSELKFLKKGNLYQQNLYLSHRRACLLLLDSKNKQLNEWKIYRSVTAKKPDSEYYNKLLELYKQHLIMEGMSESTISFAMRVGSLFFIYLECLGIDNINNLKSIIVSNFFSQDLFSKRKPKGVQAYAYKLRKQIIFMEEQRIVNNEYLHLAIPKLFAKQVSIVTTISPKAEQHLTSTDKLSEPLGKRNQAIILLALRLGMRRSDIVNLTFSNIDWQNDTITFIQKKTKISITLPLLTDVGNALMDYILHSRSKTDTEVIFLRGYAPYKSLKAASASGVSRKYLSKFDPVDCPEKGLHILRRTAATKLLANKVPMSIISASLGHLDPNSANVYISADSQKMRKCALNLVGIECTREELT